MHGTFRQTSFPRINCLYDEMMQNRMYGIPQDPVLVDAKKLYDWAVGEDEYEEDSGHLELLEDGPVVEVTGETPVFRAVHSKPLIVQERPGVDY